MKIVLIFILIIVVCNRNVEPGCKRKDGRSKNMTEAPSIVAKTIATVNSTDGTDKAGGTLPFTTSSSDELVIDTRVELVNFTKRN